MPDNIKSIINFKELNLKQEIYTSREKAELYICAKANLLLKNINSENIIEVNKLINQLRKINPQSNNIGELMLKSVVMQSKQILFKVISPIELYIPQEWHKIILDFDSNNIYGIPFDVIQDKAIAFGIASSDEKEIDEINKNEFNIFSFIKNQ